MNDKSMLTCSSNTYTVQVVIAASIVFFQTAASGANIAGTTMALSGVLLYSIAKRSKPTEPVDVEKVSSPTCPGTCSCKQTVADHAVQLWFQAGLGVSQLGDQ